MSNAAGAVVRHGAAKLILGDFFVRDGLDDVGTGDEHVTGLVDHGDEIRYRRRVDRAAGARSHDRGDLGNHAGTERVPQKNIGVSGERYHTFLDPGAAGVIQTDDGRSHLRREIHNLADLLRVGFAERTAEDCEVLREDVYQAAVDPAITGNDSIAGVLLLLHAEIKASMRDEFIDLFKGIFVEQKRDSLARGEFPFGALPVHALGAAADFGGTVHLGKLLDAGFGGYLSHKTRK